jgi:hypothetical protein
MITTQDPEGAVTRVQWMMMNMQCRLYHWGRARPAAADPLVDQPPGPGIRLETTGGCPPV